MKQSQSATHRSFSRAAGGVAAIHDLPDHFPDDCNGFAGRLPGGQGDTRDSAHEFRTIVIDLFLTPYMPFGNGDRDRIGVVINPGTFTNEGYRIYCLMIFRIVKGNTDKKMLSPQRKTRRKPRHDSVSWTSRQEKCREAGTMAFSVGGKDANRSGTGERETEETKKGLRNEPQTFEIPGATYQSRTGDLLITNQLLYQLS